jgi:hypothetical protein
MILKGFCRSRWRIENSLHWALDVTMNEDRARNRTGNGAKNLALLRRMALISIPLRGFGPSCTATSPIIDTIQRKNTSPTQS